MPLSELTKRLTQKGIVDEETEKILRQIELMEYDEDILVIFPHKYLFDLYSNRIDKIIQNQTTKKIKYKIKDKDINNYKISKSHINYDYYNNFLFKNFIVNKDNKTAAELCRQISENKKIQYNPINLVGNKSTGKTHLVKSIINSYKGRSFISSILEFKNLTETNKENDIIINIKLSEILIIEDIHEIVNNIHLLNFINKIMEIFIRENKQIVTTFKGCRNDLKILPETIHKMIFRGLILILPHPDLELKIKFIKFFCKQNQISISKNDIFTMANICDNIFFINKYLNKIMLDHISGADNEQKLSSRKIYHDHVQIHSLDQNYFNRIISLVCSSFQISAAELMSKSKKRNLAMARKVAMYLCKLELKWSYPRIGAVFGCRHHSTAVYNIQKINEKLAVDPDLNQMIQDLRTKCTSPLA